MEAVDFDNMRRAMVDSQLRTSGVTSAWVIAAMGELPRENFVPAAHRSTAYMDRSVVGDIVLNPPVATALMLQAADVMPDDKVLLIGQPDGYVARLLSMRTDNLVTIDSLNALSASDFSVILVDGAVETLPERLIAAASEGARVVTGIADHGVTRLASGIVRAGKVALRPFADTEIAILPEFARAREFVF